MSPEEIVHEIIDILERADTLFNLLPKASGQVLGLWEEGVDKIGKALWVYEKENEYEGNHPDGLPAE